MMATPEATRRSKRGLTHDDHAEEELSVKIPRLDEIVDDDEKRSRASSISPAVGSLNLRRESRGGQDKPAELFRKDLISAMKLADSEQLQQDTYFTISDPWKQEWESGVQVPVNPSETIQRNVVVKPIAGYKLRFGSYAFKLPKKYLHASQDETFKQGVHDLHETQKLADEMCRYDLDDIDVMWLTKFNEEREAMGLEPVYEWLMEKVIEELESQCYTNMQNTIKTVEGLGIEYDENVVCDVCRNPEGEDSNEIVFCDGCDICVHQACYGIKNIPEGSWLCRTCVLGIQPQCILCPKTGGAMKSTKSGTKWAHVSCALWIPEVSIGCPEKMEPITKISQIPSSRWSLICSLCRERSGACIQCSVKTCKTAFHVTCAFNNNLTMKTILDEDRDDVQLKAHCAKHSGKKKDEGSPKKEPGTPKRDLILKRDLATPTKPESEMTEEEKTELRSHRLGKLAEEFYACVEVSEVAEACKLEEELVDNIYSFWVLKRKSNFNRPLLTPKTEEADLLLRQREDSLVARMKMFIHLRQDLERVRNLCYMVSRREKIRRQLYSMKEEVFKQQVLMLDKLRGSHANTRDYSVVVDAHREPLTIYDQYNAILRAADLTDQKARLESQNETCSESEDDEEPSRHPRLKNKRSANPRDSKRRLAFEAKAKEKKKLQLKPGSKGKNIQSTGLSAEPDAPTEHKATTVSLIVESRTHNSTTKSESLASAPVAGSSALDSPRTKAGSLLLSSPNHSRTRRSIARSETADSTPVSVTVVSESACSPVAPGIPSVTVVSATEVRTRSLTAKSYSPNSASVSVAQSLASVPVSPNPTAVSRTRSSAVAAECTKSTPLSATKDSPVTSRTTRSATSASGTASSTPVSRTHNSGTLTSLTDLGNVVQSNTSLNVGSNEPCQRKLIVESPKDSVDQNELSSESGSEASVKRRSGRLRKSEASLLDSAMKASQIPPLEEKLSADTIPHTPEKLQGDTTSPSKTSPSDQGLWLRRSTRTREGLPEDFEEFIRKSESSEGDELFKVSLENSPVSKLPKTKNSESSQDDSIFSNNNTVAKTCLFSGDDDKKVDGSGNEEQKNLEQSTPTKRRRSVRGNHLNTEETLTNFKGNGSTLPRVEVSVDESSGKISLFVRKQHIHDDGKDSSDIDKKPSKRASAGGDGNVFHRYSLESAVSNPQEEKKLKAQRRASARLQNLGINGLVSPSQLVVKQEIKDKVHHNLGCLRHRNLGRKHLENGIVDNSQRKMDDFLVKMRSSSAIEGDAGSELFDADHIFTKENKPNNRTHPNRFRPIKLELSSPGKSKKMTLLSSPQNEQVSPSSCQASLTSISSGRNSSERRRSLRQRLQSGTSDDLNNHTDVTDSESVQSHDTLTPTLRGSKSGDNIQNYGIVLRNRVADDCRSNSSANGMSDSEESVGVIATSDSDYAQSEESVSSGMSRSLRTRRSRNSLPLLASEDASRDSTSSVRTSSRLSRSFSKQITSFPS